ncbi:MAG TPA: DUF4870 domain-containing protein [Dongiaceae bacterium]|nr:DUF4870 domain-containing protein [Dongiaceae bacterium]
MAFCKACGQEIGTAGFCPKCGANQGAAAPAAAAAAPTDGIQENVAGLLCYIFGWISGLIFLLIDKRPFVKFHGAQAIALNIGFFIVWIAFWVVTFVLGMITAAMHLPIGFLFGLLFPVVGLAFLALWIFCMYKAYQHEKFKVPIIGNIVEKMVS